MDAIRKCPPIIIIIFVLSSHTTNAKIKGSQIIRVGAKEVKPFIIIRKTNGSEFVKFDGFFGKLMQTIADRLKLLCEIRSPEVNEMGKKLENGTWTGYLGLLAEKKIDVLINAAVTENRLEIMDYTVPYRFDDVRFMIRSPGEITKAFIITRPYMWKVWISIIISWLIGSLVLYFLSKFDNQLKGKSHPTLDRVIWYTFGSIILQGNDIIYHFGFKSRWFTTAWWFSVTVIAAGYSGMLMSFMSFPGFEDAPATFSELAHFIRNNEYSCGITKKWNIINTQIMYSKRGLLKEFKDKINADPSKCLVESVNDGLNRISEMKYAYIEYDIYFTMFLLKHNFKDYLISKDQLFSSPISVTFRKNFPLKNQFNRIVEKCIESGLLHKWEDESLMALRMFKNGDDHMLQKPLSLIDVQSAFFLLLFGHILGFITLILEIIVKRILPPSTDV